MWHHSMGLMIKKMCGELECPEYYLCQSHDLQCYPCHSYCNQSSHNFDRHLCERQCQDYIHDYIKHYVKAGEIQDIIQEKDFIKYMMIAFAILIVITLILICMMVVFIWNREIWTTKNESKIPYFKKKTAFSKFKSNTVSIVSETANNPAMMMTAQTSRTTALTMDKLPSEDITLETQDFTGYDNLGMWGVSPETCSKL